MKTQYMYLRDPRNHDRVCTIAYTREDVSPETRRFTIAWAINRASSISRKSMALLASVGLQGSMDSGDHFSKERGRQIAEGRLLKGDSVLVVDAPSSKTSQSVIISAIVERYNFELSVQSDYYYDDEDDEFSADDGQDEVVPIVPASLGSICKLYQKHGYTPSLDLHKMYGTFSG